MEEMTKEEMQRFLIKEAQRGSTELEAYRNLLEIIGVEYPIDQKEDAEEMTRLLLGLRAAGWDEKEINDFLLYIQTGEKQYEPRPKEKLAG